ncbi:MAG: hypothetical protein U9Q67_02105, partial [Patescibacteria group bacterium]|nr:hypothetical protein [Patescibacteria group bacterium]
MVHTIIQQLKKSSLFTSIIICGSFFFTLPYRLFKSQKVIFGKNFISHWKLKVSGPGKVIFGNNVNAGAYSEPNIFTTLHPDAQIRIGNNCRLNGIHAQSQSSITIGDNCIIGSAI